MVSLSLRMPKWRLILNSLLYFIPGSALTSCSGYDEVPLGTLECLEYEPKLETDRLLNL